MADTNTTTTLKSNDNSFNNDDLFHDAQQGGTINLPMPPTQEEMRSEMEIYARFMRHLRIVPNSKAEIKILSAIQFTADLLNQSDAFVAKTLVDLGLRAPRKSYPADYLEFVDGATVRDALSEGAPSEAVRDLCEHWHKIGEDKFAAIKYTPVYAEQTFLIET